MVENKTTLQVNKYADRFLMAEVKNFEGAAQSIRRHGPQNPAHKREFQGADSSQEKCNGNSAAGCGEAEK